MVGPVLRRVVAMLTTCALLVGALGAGQALAITAAAALPEAAVAAADLDPHLRILDSRAAWKPAPASFRGDRSGYRSAGLDSIASPEGLHEPGNRQVRPPPATFRPAAALRAVETGILESLRIPTGPPAGSR